MRGGSLWHVRGQHSFDSALWEGQGFQWGAGVAHTHCGISQFLWFPTTTLIPFPYVFAWGGICSTFFPFSPKSFHYCDLFEKFPRYKLPKILWVFPSPSFHAPWHSQFAKSSPWSPQSFGSTFKHAVLWDMLHWGNEKSGKFTKWILLIISWLVDSRQTSCCIQPARRAWALFIDLENRSCWFRQFGRLRSSHWQGMTPRHAGFFTSWQRRDLTLPSFREWPFPWHLCSSNRKSSPSHGFLKLRNDPGISDQSGICRSLLLHCIAFHLAGGIWKYLDFADLHAIWHCGGLRWVFLGKKLNRQVSLSS